MSRAGLAEKLERLCADGLLRGLQPRSAVGGKFTVDSQEVLNFSSNDYLNLAGDERLKAASREAIDRYGCGATASRLMAGTLDIHEELERGLARLVGAEAALVFGSGFLANIGVLSSLAGRGDAIFADRLNHASLVDGARLSGAATHRYRHNDIAHLESLLGGADETGRKIIVTDSLFSMDGDIADLAGLWELARRYECTLIVDDAHAIGVFCNGGGGICSELDEVQPDAIIGTLSKSLGGYGGFVAGSAKLREFLINCSRSFIYSTALPPACAAGALAALDVLADSPGLGAELLSRADFFRGLLVDAGLDVGPSRSQIVPVLVGDNEKAVEFSRALLGCGIIAVAVRPPTVPAGTSRLRMSVTLAHETEDLRRAADTLARIAGQMGIL